MSAKRKPSSEPEDDAPDDRFERFGSTGDDVSFPEVPADESDE